jgi:hypothetical protein
MAKATILSGKGVAPSPWSLDALKNQLKPKLIKEVLKAAPPAKKETSAPPESRHEQQYRDPKALQKLFKDNKLPRSNPPQNIFTRGYNPFILDTLTTEYVFKNKDDLRDLKVRGNMNDRLGYITMAPFHFAVINKVVTDPWTFRFAYNPTAITLSSGLDSVPDYSNYGAVEGDVSVPLSSSSTGSFTIWLNRIQDLRNLAVGDYSGYAKNLDQVEIQGLLARGTDYDVDYLYRVTNGLVYFNTDQFANTYSGAGSADQGLLMGGLVDIYFGGLKSNLRIFGQITGITVNHLLFNKDLVPVLSTVDISFIRYPYTARGSKTTNSPGATTQVSTGKTLPKAAEPTK